MEACPDLQVAPTQPDSFGCAAFSEDHTLLLNLSGTAETAEEPVLAQLLERTHERATAIHAVEVKLDITSLKFISSSCFKDFVAWLARVMALAPTDRYRIRFKSNPKFRWQRASLSALGCFAVDLVTVE